MYMHLTFRCHPCYTKVTLYLGWTSSFLEEVLIEKRKKKVICLLVHVIHKKKTVLNIFTAESSSFQKVFSWLQSSDSRGIDLFLLNPIIVHNNNKNKEKAQLYINNAYCTNFRRSISLSCHVTWTHLRQMFVKCC